MKVILIKSVPGLGVRGDVKDVKEGYANNFLLSQKLAEIVSDRKVKNIQDDKKREEKKKKTAMKSKDKIASKINGKSFKFNLKADETGTLYTKLNSKFIAEKVKKGGYDILEKDVNLPSPIKKIGEYVVELRLGNTKPKIKILINK
ncbi:MAG: 50S ribosomal protein L9 [Patescibacteria group bacterium]|jgi:large subunit ribosomal protein L9|nr:50S ribosomal protein L9 [Patescibacteria group bacterium]